MQKRNCARLRGAESVYLPRLQINIDAISVLSQIDLNEEVFREAHSNERAVYHSDAAAERFTATELISVARSHQLKCLTWNLRSPHCVQHVRLRGTSSFGKDRHRIPVGFCQLR
jgi:hypothetical protein